MVNNYKSICSLPNQEPTSVSAWTELFATLNSQDDVLYPYLKMVQFSWRWDWIQATAVLAVQDPFFDDKLKPNYSKYLEIDTVKNVVKAVKNEIQNISSAEAIKLYHLCAVYAKDVLSAIRTAKLNTMTPFSANAAWIYGRGDEHQNTVFKDLKDHINSHDVTWMNTAIQMNIDGCLCYGSGTEEQNQREWNVKMLVGSAIDMTSSNNSTSIMRRRLFNIPVQYADLNNFRSMTSDTSFHSWTPSGFMYTGYFLMNK